MADKEEEIKITVICWKCDRKFSFMLSIIKKKQEIFMGEDGENLGPQLIWPKTYVVPCPYCGAESEVDLP